MEGHQPRPPQARRPPPAPRRSPEAPTPPAREGWSPNPRRLSTGEHSQVGSQRFSPAMAPLPPPARHPTRPDASPGDARRASERRGSDRYGNGRRGSERRGSAIEKQPSSEVAGGRRVSQAGRRLSERRLSGPPSGGEESGEGRERPTESLLPPVLPQRRPSMDNDVEVEKGEDEPVGLIMREGLVLHGVTSGSPGDRAGVGRFVGRLLTHVDGRAVLCPSDVQPSSNHTKLRLRFAKRGEEPPTAKPGEVPSLHGKEQLKSPESKPRKMTSRGSLSRRSVQGNARVQAERRVEELEAEVNGLREEAAADRDAGSQIALLMSIDKLSGELQQAREALLEIGNHEVQSQLGSTELGPRRSSFDRIPTISNGRGGGRRLSLEEREPSNPSNNRRRSNADQIRSPLKLTP
eukprot:Hpha_TRINITY_DN2470_c0_g1::TRINITY_DN2470_c0_g1_i2::g.24732::m.24732